MKSKIPDGWEEYKLEELTRKIRSGGTPSSTNELYYSGNIPFVIIEDITGCNKYLKKTIKHITPEAIKSSSTWIVPKKSLLYTIYATLGDACINEIEVTTNQAILNIIPNEKINLEFFYYYLKWYKQYIHKHTSQTTQSNLNAEIVKNFFLIIPKSKIEQERITTILSEIDLTIQKTMQLIEKNKMIKEGLVRDLLSKGVDESGNFHNDFKDSELGKIPKEWSIEKLNQILLFNKCRSGIYKEKSYYGKGMNILKIGDVFEKDFYDGEETQKVPLTESEYLQNDVNEGDIIIAIASVKLEGVGKVMYVKHLKEKTAFDHNVANARVNPKIYDSLFLFYVLKSRIIRKEIERLCTQVGTTFLKTSTIHEFLVPLLEVNEQKRITEILSSIDQKIDSEENYLNKLINIKTGLMQDLLTGKVRVKGA